MRIAMTHVFSWPEVRRGGERFLHELASALARRGNEVTIVSTAPSRSLTVEEGVRVVRMRRRTNRRREELYFGHRILPLLIRENFDAVHSLGASDAAGSVIASWVRRERTTIFTALGIPETSDAAYEKRDDRYHHDFMCKRVDVYGCLSAYALRSLEESYGRRGTLTPGGVRLSRFRPGRRADRPTLLYSGAINEYRKRVPTLLQALDLIARDVPDVQLWLSGSGDATPLLAEASPAARERTTVYDTNGPPIEELYAKAWVTALPSFAEAFGLVIIESLASGTPVVGTTAGALPELITDDIGALSVPSDAESLAEACRRVLDMSQERDIVDRCRAAAEPYDWDALAPRYEHLYRHGVNADGDEPSWGGE
jgi:phosphatidyl-myo-inositol alpha-mannosyltransferase